MLFFVRLSFLKFFKAFLNFPKMKLLKMMFLNASFCEAFYNNILADLERTPMHSANARRANHDAHLANYFGDFDGMLHEMKRSVRLDGPVNSMRYGQEALTKQLRRNEKFFDQCLQNRYTRSKCRRFLTRN